MLKEVCMSSDAYDEILRRVEQLSLEEQLDLMGDIIKIVRRRAAEKPLLQTEAKHCHSIMELQGLGKEIWEGIDAQEYVNEERKSWGGVDARQTED
jgi:hypothetical protein